MDKSYKCNTCGAIDSRLCNGDNAWCSECGDTEGLELVGIEEASDFSIQELVDFQRSNGFMVQIKAMPQDHSFTVPGASSEYDAPHGPQDIWEGKTVVEVHDMKYRYGRHRRPTQFGVGDDIMSALKDLIKKFEA